MKKRKKYIVVKAYRRKIMRKKHEKRAIRLVLFFILLVIFGIIEDMIALYLTGVSSTLFIIFKMENIFVILLIAIIFTIIAEFTEKIYEGEKPKDIIKKTAKVIKKEVKEEEKVIGKKLKMKKKK